MEMCEIFAFPPDCMHITEKRDILLQTYCEIVARAKVQACKIAVVVSSHCLAVRRQYETDGNTKTQIAQKRDGQKT